MTRRCPVCGEKLIKTYDHMLGKDVYISHDHRGDYHG